MFQSNPIVTVILCLGCLGAALPAQAPDFEATSIAYDTGTPQDTRMPWSMRQVDLDADGDLDVVVVNGPAIPKLTVLRNRGEGSFDQPELYATASGFWDDAVDLAAGDVDGDGDPDVVVTNTGNAGTGATVALHRNRGDGTFAPFVRFPTGGGPTGVVVVDLDGDGFRDVATADHGRIGQGTTVSLLWNDRAGGFLPPRAIQVGAAPYKLAAGDLDGDGRPEVVVAREGQRLVVLHNDGGRAFSTREHAVLPNQWAGNVYPAIELADLDLDGDLDAVYSSTKTGFQQGSGAGAIALLYNDGTGAFGAPVALGTLPETQGAVDLTVADWTGDGWPDIASAHMTDGAWLVFESAGRRSWQAPVELHAGAESIAVDAVDVNGDAAPDMLVLNRFSLGLTVYENPLGGSFADPTAYPMVTAAPVVGRGMSWGDVDGDNDLDMAVAYAGVINNAGGIGIARNRGDGTFAPPQVLTTPIKARALELRDLNNDGRPDLLWGDDFPPYQFHVRLNQGGGSFGPQVSWNATGCRIGDVEAFDFDGDGDLDVAISVSAACSGPGLPIALRLGNGDGTFGPTYVHALSTFTTFVTHGDIDGDGIQDLVTNSGFNGIEVSLGNGDGTFQAPLTSFTDWGPGAIAVADLDGDGVLDLATSNKGRNKGESSVSVLIGFGDGLFWPAVNYPSSYDPQLANDGPIVAGDVDGDGDVDLMTANWSSQDVSFYRNRGNGTFERQLRYGAGDECTDLAWADFTGDGIEDLGLVVTPGRSLSFYPAAVVLRGTGGSTWRDLGFALAGTSGLPRLSSATPFQGGVTVVVALAGARPQAPGAHVLGAARADLPVFGGVMVPAPQLAVGFGTDPSGAASLTFRLPLGLPPGLELFVQSWILDPAGPQGLAASNALQGTHY